MSAGKNGKKRQRGFTLIELLVVLVILTLVAGLVAPRLIPFIGGAKQDAARLQIRRLANALDLYRLDTGRYPSSKEGLAALVEKPDDGGRWNGPYIQGKQVPADPWGRPYNYRYPGRHGLDYDLFSLGADGREGGEGEDADIANWQNDDGGR